MAQALRSHCASNCHSHGASNTTTCHGKSSGAYMAISLDISLRCMSWAYPGHMAGHTACRQLSYVRSVESFHRARLYSIYIIRDSIWYYPLFLSTIIYKVLYYPLYFLYTYVGKILSFDIDDICIFICIWDWIISKYRALRKKFASKIFGMQTIKDGIKRACNVQMWACFRVHKPWYK